MNDAQSQGAPRKALEIGAIALGALGALALAALVVITLVSVFWRYVLRDPIFGIEDISTMALTVFVAGAVAYGAIRGAHVTVGIIAKVANRRVTRITDLIARILGIGITGYACLGLFDKGSCGMPCGAITANMNIVHTPFYYLLGVSFGFYCLLLIWQTYQALRHWNDPDAVGDDT